MDTINQTDTTSSKGFDDNKSNKPVRQLSSQGHNRLGSSHLYPSAHSAPYNGLLVDQNNVPIRNSHYGQSDFKNHEEQRHQNTQLLLHDPIHESMLLTGSCYPSEQQIRQQQQQQQLEQRQQPPFHELRLQELELSQPSKYHSSHYDYGLEDDSDHDMDKEIKQGEFPLGQVEHGSSRNLQRKLRPQSAHEVHSSNFISEEEFLVLADDYLLSLSPKKREKALLTNSMYQRILMVLLQPKNTQISTAQFRFWAKKMFTLSTTETHHIVCHEGKPVATKECLYDVLVYCHRKSSHGGRDKTSAEVRQHYSWVPKELIARFVKHCPLCSSRRHSLQRPSSALDTISGYDSFSSSSAVRFQTNKDSSSGHHWHQGQSEDLLQPDDSYVKQQQPDRHISSHDRSHLAILQQQQQQNIHQSEHQSQYSQQRSRTESSSGRYYEELYASHEGNYRSGSTHVNSANANVQTFLRSGGARMDDSGIGPPVKRERSLQISLGSESHHSLGYGKTSEPTELDQDEYMKDEDDEMEDDDDEFEVMGHEDESQSSNPFRYDDQPFAGNRCDGDKQNDDTNDCVPSGLVGVPQEARQLPSFESTQQRSSSQSRQHQTQHSNYPSQHAHDVFQQRYLSSPGQLPLAGTTIYHPNGHVLHDRHPMRRLSMEQTGYTYGYTYPYNNTIGSTNVLVNQAKTSKGPISMFPQHQQQQQQQINLVQSGNSSHDH